MEERFDLVMVFHFTGDLKLDMFEKVIQTLIDTPPAPFLCFQDLYDDVETNLQTDLIHFERAVHT